MFKKFTTANEILDYIGFPQWKKSHERFNYNLFLEKGGYPRKSKLVNITFGLSMGCMVTGAISACFSMSKGISLSTTWVPLLMFSLLCIRLITPHIMNFIDWYLWQHYSRKFKKFMSEERLVEFVDLLSQDPFCHTSLKEKNNYKDVILACHHQDKDFVKLAYDKMNKFYVYRERQLEKAYNEDIVKNFLNKEVQKNAQVSLNKPVEKTEDKFQFMG